MNTLSVEAATAARLEAYRFKPDYQGNPVEFSPAVIETVAEVAGRQALYGADYRTFLDDVGGQVQTLEAPNGKQYQVLDIRRDEEDGVVSYHLPMANPLDPNQRFQLATVAAANPHKRFIVTGNPSGGAYASGQLTHRQRAMVRRGDFGPLVEADQHYLDKHGIDEADQIGYSYGADKATELAASGEVAVSRLVVIEPVVGRRSLTELASDFRRTAEALAEYADAPGLASFTAARADGLTENQYARGLLRPTNIAIAQGLARGEFGHRFSKALHVQQAHRIRATLAWGTLSELAHIKSSRQLRLETEKKRGASFEGMLLETAFMNLHDPVVDMKLALGRHALANDIHLQAALVTQGLTRR